MLRLIGLWLVGCVLLGLTPAMAQDDVYDGPAAIKPLTVTPQPQRSAPPNTVCDFEHQCYPEKGGPMVPAPMAPPVAAVKPVAPRSPATNVTPDDPLIAAWRPPICPHDAQPFRLEEACNLLQPLHLTLSLLQMSDSVLKLSPSGDLKGRLRAFCRGRRRSRDLLLGRVKLPDFAFERGLSASLVSHSGSAVG